MSEEENIVGYELENGKFVCEDCVDEDEFEEGDPILDTDEVDEIPICCKCGKRFPMQDVQIDDEDDEDLDDNEE